MNHEPQSTVEGRVGPPRAKLSPNSARRDIRTCCEKGHAVRDFAFSRRDRAGTTCSVVRATPAHEEITGDVLALVRNGDFASPIRLWSGRVTFQSSSSGW